MTTIRKCVVLGASVAFAAISWTVLAQDDLDDLLKDLEGEAAKPAGKAQSAESPAAEAPVAETPAQAAPAAEAPSPAEAPAAAEPAAAEPVAAQETSEAPATPAAAAEEPAVAEAPAAEPPAQVAAEAPAPAAEDSTAETAKKVDEVASLLNDIAAAPVVAADNPDKELLDNPRTTEKLRRLAHDEQAKREIAEARENMRVGAYKEMVRHYGLALKLLNGSQSMKRLQKECSQGIAEGLYQAALQEYDIGQYTEAVALMEKARDMRHPRAGRMLEKWNAQAAQSAAVAAVGEHRHRINDEDFKSDREQIRRHLRRGRQYLAVRDMVHALEECEIVLRADPYNQDAIRLRRAIQRKRQTILEQERVQAREGMIADVDEAWRPVYAVNAAQLDESASETVKTQTGEDPERTMEQDIERRMKEMRLPTISFKPPATIMEAVDWFTTASKDYDRPDIPLEKRGFNFVLRPPPGALVQTAQQTNDDESFASDESTEGKTGAGGFPQIPPITASDISFYEALKLVCDSVEYKFIVRGPIVMVMHKDMSTAELLSRKYDVLDAFLERMTAASSDVKEMKSQGFGGSSKKGNEEGDENTERDWKAFFEQMGVKWPEGSTIMYIKTLGKLYVRNTRENLAEFEKVLQEMGSQPKLIEIEARFVEVEQADLNSLGFEWILNSDYSLSDTFGLGKALGLKGGTWGSESGSRSYNVSNSRGDSLYGLAADGSQTDASTTYRQLQTGKWSDPSYNAYQSSTEASSISSSTSYNRTENVNGNGGNWIKNAFGKRNIGVNAFGGTSAQQNGNRYLSTTGNHISGDSKSDNDQFMRVNAFLGEADLSMILHMLSQRSDTDLLSAPKVVTKSGENAVIKVVTEYIYPQDYDVQLQSSGSSSSGGSGGSGGSSAILAVVEPQNFTMREVGVILDVTPTYSEANGGTIDLELKPQVVDEPTWQNYGMKIPFSGNSSVQSFEGLADIPLRAVEAVRALGGTISDDAISAYSDEIMSASMTAMRSSSGGGNMTWYDAPMNQPFFHVRSIDSKVSITPGATVVMGGLITESRKAMDDKVPFLGDLPYVGRLFRSHAEKTIKRNLLIFVTGRLITPAGRELSMGEEAADEAEVKAAPKE